MRTLQKCNTSKDSLLVDRLNELPDEILVKILCLATMKEAAQTSILSRRWKDLWKYTTYLEFDKMEKLHGHWFFGTLEYQRRCLDINDVIDRLEQHQIGRRTAGAIFSQKRLNYVKWVNGILDSLKSPTIYKFRVHFDLDVKFKDNIDRWVDLVIEKGVQMLDLDLEEHLVRKDSSYPFPIKILDHPNISLLRSLSLNYVDLTNQTLDTLVSKIPCIESLSVSSSTLLINTYVFIAPPKLKHLAISKCKNLKILRINAFDLKSLTYYGPLMSRLILDNTPNLIDVSVGGGVCLRPNFVLPKNPEPSHFCYRLQSLTIKIQEMSQGYLPKIPVMGNLKRLELVLLSMDDSSLLSCSSLIEACPGLCKFILEFDWLTLVEKDREFEMKYCSLPNSLKEVELRRFRGGTTDVEMAYFLFENAQSLEKVCIDTRNPGMVDLHSLDQAIVEAKSYGMMLATEFCPNAEIQIL